MSNVVFVTGNANKAAYFAKLAGVKVDHHAVDVPEIQSLDSHEIGTAKARAAYEILQRPVVVEDTAFSINSLGKLPGVFIKWFIEELGFERICRLADVSDDRSAVASSVYVYFDGQEFRYFEGALAGTIPEHPRGDAGFGWNPIFVPGAQDQTLGEMDEEDFHKFYVRIKPLPAIGDFIRSLDS